ncbi:MAG: glycosyltransferase [Candidatus Zixiibacteriota bacterium]|nr:MAG: glycosyltransferase [candidate division Zixibacteria bacterium]
MRSLREYEKIVGTAVLNQLEQLAGNLTGLKVVHVNSTKSGGGVAEILAWMIPFMQELGIETAWEVIKGDGTFFNVTKTFHNGLQGQPVNLLPSQIKAYEQTSAENAERLRPILEAADMVFVHDPQPAFLLRLCPNRQGTWIWRCHIDASHPSRSVWKYLRPLLEGYDASIFSMAEFSKSLPHPQFLIAPSIDPLSEKNIELKQREKNEIRNRFSLDPKRPILTQISRYDRFKDPLGVIEGYRLIRKFTPVQLVLAGGGADDDPEGAEVLRQVEEAAAGDPDIHVLSLPADAHLTINALQRLSDIIIQKSTREGFGLTVTEGLWKGKPVIGGDVGGIRLQVINYHTGFLVNSPEGMSQRVRYLLNHQNMMQIMGIKGREFVRENFLLTRHLREYLTLMVGLRRGFTDRLIAAA